MKNPFPEFGEIKEVVSKITVDAESPMMNAAYGYLSGDQGSLIRYIEFPTHYELIIKYQEYEASFTCFNLTEEQYKELETNIFENADMRFNKAGWPVSLKWKDFEFKATSVVEVLYRERSV